MFGACSWECPVECKKHSVIPKEGESCRVNQTSLSDYNDYLRKSSSHLVIFLPDYRDRRIIYQ